MAQSNSEFLKMIASLQALTGASGVNLSNIMGDLSESKDDDTHKYDSKKIPVKVKDVEFMRKYIEGGKLKITETNAEYLLEQNPNIFQGINLELVDEDDDDYFEES